MDVGYDGPFFAEKGIEQRALACIGGSYDRYRDAVLYGVSKAERVHQTADMSQDAVQKAVQLGAVCKFYLFFTEVQFQFHQ